MARLANRRTEALLYFLIGLGGDAHHTGIDPLLGFDPDGGPRRTRALGSRAEVLQCVGRSWCAPRHAAGARLGVTEPRGCRGMAAISAVSVLLLAAERSQWQRFPSLLPPPR